MTKCDSWLVREGACSATAKSLYNVSQVLSEFGTWLVLHPHQHVFHLPLKRAHSAIQYTLGQEEEYSNGSKGQTAEQEEPTGKKVIKVVEVVTEEDKRNKETHQGEKVPRAIALSICDMLIRF